MNAISGNEVPGRTYRPAATLRDWVPLAVGLALVVLVGLLTATTVVRNRQHNAMVVHTLEVLGTAQAVRLAMIEATSTQRGLMLSGHPLFRERYTEAYEELPVNMAKLQALTADNPQQTAQITLLKTELDARVRELNRVDELIRQGRIRAAAERVVLARLQADGVQLKLFAVMAEERALLEERQRKAHASGQRLLWLSVGGLALASLLVGSSIASLRRRTEALMVANAKVQALNEGLEARVAARTADLSEANEEIQRFAYIVSHDLRSPLVNVMGFTAELEESQKTTAALIAAVDHAQPGLVTAQQRSAVTQDMPESIGFIRASTARMDRLIKAILRLSREGRRPMSAEPVELGAVVQGIADSMRAQLDAAGATLKVGPMPTVVTDRLAVEQVLGNLMDNAVKYLRPGIAGAISVTAHPLFLGHAITVADNGRGIAPEDQERVFELFRRAGRQDQPGEGIGLAHVRALARRLGGNVRLESVPGEGSRFTLELPAAIAGNELLREGAVDG